MKLRKLLMPISAVVLASVWSFTAHAAAEKVVIGDIDDMSGLYADILGPKGVEAIKMAVADFGGSALGQPIEVLTFDHQNKPALGAEKFRECPRRVDHVARRQQHWRQPRHVSCRHGEENPVYRDRRGGRLAHRQG